MVPWKPCQPATQLTNPPNEVKASGWQASQVASLSTHTHTHTLDCVPSSYSSHHIQGSLNSMHTNAISVFNVLNFWHERYSRPVNCLHKACWFTEHYDDYSHLDCERTDTNNRTDRVNSVVKLQANTHAQAWRYYNNEVLTSLACGSVHCSEECHVIW